MLMTTSVSSLVPPVVYIEYRESYIGSLIDSVDERILFEGQPPNRFCNLSLVMHVYTETMTLTVMKCNNIVRSQGG